MSAAPLPEPVSIPAPPDAAPAAAPSTKASIATRAFVTAITSKAALKLEFALVRYIVYAVLASLGIHDHFLGL